MGFSNNSLQVETVTPEKAAEFLKANYAHNRRYKPAWVEYLAREMREGRFMSTAEIHIMYRNGEPVMINGQHTCRAIIMYGKPVRVTVRRTTTTEVGQIAMAYAFGHDTGIRRSFMDGMNAYGLAEQTGLIAEVVNKLTGAILYMRQGFVTGKRWGTQLKDSPAEMVSYVLFFAPTMTLFNTIVMPCDKSFLRKLRRRSSLSVALLMLYYQPEKAIEFWSQLAHPDRLEWNDPRVTARRYIETANFHKQERDEEAKLTRQIARLWRAFCEGKPLQQVGGLTESAPLALEGTPFTGKQRLNYMPDVDVEWTPVDNAKMQYREMSHSE